MLKYVAPLEQRLRHLPARIPRHGKVTSMTTVADGQATTVGQRMAEHTAALIGSWAFLGVQALFLALWVVVNALAIVHFDPSPFILLNLMLSFQAAFTGPVLLIAANVGAIRDHKQSDRMEQLERHIEDRDEQIAAKLDALLAAMPLPPPEPPPPATAAAPVPAQISASTPRPRRKVHAA